MFGGFHYIINDITVEVLLELLLEHDVNDEDLASTCVHFEFTDGPLQQLLNFDDVAVSVLDGLQDGG